MERDEALKDMQAAFEAGYAKIGNKTSEAGRAYQGSLDWIAAQSQQPAPEPGEPETAVMADSMVRRVSVQTHINWRSSGNIWLDPRWKDRFIELGARYTRSQIGTNQAVYDDLKLIGAQAIAVVDSTSGDNYDTVQAQKILDKIAANAGMFIAFEGPNEPNYSDMSNWAPKTRDFQKWLFDAVRANSKIAGKKVIAPSIAGRVKADYEALGPVACDTGNLHYYTSGEPPPITAQGEDSDQSSDLDESLTDAAIISPGQNIWVTETGYAMNGPGCTNSPHFVTPSAQAKYNIRLLCEMYIRDVFKTNIYTLLDDVHRDPPRYHGLVDGNFERRPAFFALKRTLAMFNDPGEDFEPGELTFQCQLPTSVKRMPLMQRRDGSFLIGLWQDMAKSYNRQTFQDNVIPPVPITVELGSAMSWRVHYPTTDEPGAEGSGASLTVQVADHLTVVELG